MPVEGTTQEQISDANLVERVLEKLGLSERPTPDLKGLSKLYWAWCQNVSFDNLRKLIHVQSKNPATLPGDNAIDFFTFWVKHGTGGTCWAGNGALHALLTSLGFNASRGVATMMVAPDLPPNHGTVLVDMDGTRYMVDASILHEFPLQLDLEVPANVEQHRFKLKVTYRDNKWHMWWQPLHMLEGLECRLDEFPATLAGFQRRYEMSRGWSPFNYQLTVRKVIGDRTVGVAYGKWVELCTQGKETSREITGEQERLGLLVDTLGYSEEIARQLPADQPTPPPPWSDAAKKAKGLSGNK
jgi:N-hydroxyarylamine O-acetyltransferase